MTEGSEAASCRPCRVSLRQLLKLLCTAALDTWFGRSVTWPSFSAFPRTGFIATSLSIFSSRIGRGWRCRLARFEQLPKVTVQLPIYNEIYVVERLLKSVSELDYPRDLLQIQVLDDSTDNTREVTASCVEELRQRGFNVELIHRIDRVGFKAGALATGLKSANEFVCILDADFVPPKDLLRRTVDFFTDPKVGMIQTRWGHLNRCYSLLTRVQAMFLDGHLLLEQTARSRSGRFFNFNGTAGLWRRSCIEEAGGWQHDTLTEDLDLSYRAQLAGWKFVFLPDVVTPAELPVDMNGFQIAAASLDQRFDSNLQETTTHYLAQ